MDVSSLLAVTCAARAPVPGEVMLEGARSGSHTPSVPVQLAAQMPGGGEVPSLHATSVDAAMHSESPWDEHVGVVVHADVHTPHRHVRSPHSDDSVQERSQLVSLPVPPTSRPQEAAPVEISRTRRPRSRLMGVLAFCVRATHGRHPPMQPVFMGRWCCSWGDGVQDREAPRVLLRALRIGV